MKRAMPVLLAILLGAIAAGLGVGLFLKLANDDRDRLGRELAEAERKAEEALIEKQRIAGEANNKVDEANAEVARAENILRELREETTLIATAKRLYKPPTNELRGWKSFVSFHQELGFSLPSQTEIEEDVAASLTAVRSNVRSDVKTDSRWLSVVPYSAHSESELMSAYGTSTSVSYLIDGRLVTGRRGLLANTDDEMYVLRVRANGTSTHLMWIKDPSTLGGGDGFERLLSTFEFKS